VLGGGLLTLVALLIFSGAVGKSAQFPLHVWLPDAMEGPTPVSALIHAATMVVAGVYLVARMAPLFVLAPGVLDFVAFIGLTTVFVGAALALVQNDIKKILAYSTISQLGFMMLALGSLGFTAGIFHLLAHGFFKALLFLGAGSIIHAMHERQDIREMGGLRSRLPATWVAMAIAGVALAGIFPLSGFFSKDDVLFSVLDNRGSVWFAAGLAASVLTAWYVARLLYLVFLGEPRSRAAQEAHEAPLLMTLPVMALMVPAAGLGLLALAWGDYDGFGSFLVFLPFGPKPFEFHGAVFWPSLALTFSAFLMGLSMYRQTGGVAPALVRRRLSWLLTALDNNLYLDYIYQWTVDHVVLVGSRLVALFDRAVINNTGVDGTGRATLWSSFLLRYHETGLVSTYMLTIAVTAMVVVLIVITTA
ncbi:MAG: NADH-quinone oxidoreductase subunit L, partial [Dehalococcoidia bacterium]